jgi:DNA-binding transcriptional LysR family regulator
MEFEQLEAFLAIARTKSFTRSAEMLHVAQSTVTTRIKILEEHLGNPLFERDSRRVKLSAAGLVLLPYAQRIMELRLEGARAAKIEGQFEDRLVIGSLGSLWDFVFFPIINEFRLYHSQISLRLITGHSDDIIRKLMDGIVDVGLIFIPPHHPDIEILPLYEDSIHLVGHPSMFSEKREVSANELLTLPYIHMDWGSPFTEWYEQEIGRNHLPAFQVDHTSFLIKLLLNKEGVAFLPDSFCKNFIIDGKLKKIFFQSNIPLPKRKAYIVYHKRKKNSKAVQFWLQHLLKWNEKQ